MRQLQDIFGGLLDPDFDINDDDVMPKTGQTIIDLWSKVKKHDGVSHNCGKGWVMDYSDFSHAMIMTGKALSKINKGSITKKLAQSYMWATGKNASDDVCLICLTGDPSDPSTLGIGRPSTCDALYFVRSSGYDENLKPVSQGVIRVASNMSREAIYTYIEGIVNNRTKRKFWLLPGHCFDIIKKRILK